MKFKDLKPGKVFTRDYDDCPPLVKIIPFKPEGEKKVVNAISFAECKMAAMRTWGYETIEDDEKVYPSRK